MRIIDFVIFVLCLNIFVCVSQTHIPSFSYDECFSMHFLSCEVHVQWGSL